MKNFVSSRVKFTFCLLLIFFNTPSYAQVNPGDIMFVGFNADGNDGFAVVALVDIPENTTIYFTDNEWSGLPVGSGSTFVDQNEGEMTWLSGASVLPAGTVIIFEEISSANNVGYGVSEGTINGYLNLKINDEVLYAFAGTDKATPTVFLSAIANSGFTTKNGSLLNTSLTEGINATAFYDGPDVMVYTGSTSCNTTLADCSAALAAPVNWSTEDGSFDQSHDDMFPDFPRDAPLSFDGSALPVQLISFTASPYQQDKVKLSWKTAIEINNDYFTIERSGDGLEWESLDKINGAGNSFNTKVYSFIDRHTLPGISYYRLIQTDFDGTRTYSDMINVTLKSTAKIKIYPNPVADELAIITNAIEKDEVTFFNSLGQKVHPPLVSMQPGKAVYNVSGLIKGEYFIRVISANTNTPAHFFIK